jgi:hypothetical protein
VNGNKAAAAGRGGKSIKRGIPHTTGIHRIVVDQKKGKKGEKKRFNLLHPKKGEIGGLTKSCTFFQLWNKRALPK